MYKLFITILMFLFCVANIQAQTSYVMQGKITEKGSDQPIIDALIVVIGGHSNTNNLYDIALLA